MVNIFSGLRKYAGKWQLKEERDFNEEEKASFKSATVVTSQFGLSVCFMLVGGQMAFIPLSNDSQLTAGENVDLNKAKLLKLGKEGENDIYRVKA